MSSGRYLDLIDRAHGLDAAADEMTARLQDELFQVGSALGETEPPTATASSCGTKLTPRHVIPPGLNLTPRSLLGVSKAAPPGVKASLTGYHL